MNLKKSTFFAFVLMFNCFSAIPSGNPQPVSLIEWVKKQEIYFTELKNKHSDLWSRCIWTRYYTIGNYEYREYCMTPFCSEHDRQALYDTEVKLKNFQKNNKEEFKKLIEQGARFEKQDEHGKTALNYTSSDFFYHLLRSSGAKFKLESYIKTHPYTTASYAILSLAALYASCKYYVSKIPIKKTSDQRMLAMLETLQKSEITSWDSIDVHFKDEHKRTVLINYLIEQEEKLALLKTKLDELQHNDGKNIEYHQALFEYLHTIAQTKAYMQHMIEKGADINVCDSFHQSCADYCKTTAIYKQLYPNNTSTRDLSYQDILIVAGGISLFGGWMFNIAEIFSTPSLHKKFYFF